MVAAGQASRTSVLENVGAVAGDVAEGGASYRNEVEADLAIRCLTFRLALHNGKGMLPSH